MNFKNLICFLGLAASPIISAASVVNENTGNQNATVQPTMQDQMQVLEYLTKNEKETEEILEDYVEKLATLKPEELEQRLVESQVPPSQAKEIAKDPSIFEKKKDEIVDSSMEAIKRFSAELKEKLANYKPDTETNQPAVTA